VSALTTAEVQTLVDAASSDAYGPHGADVPLAAPLLALAEERDALVKRYLAAQDRAAHHEHAAVESQRALDAILMTLSNHRSRRSLGPCKADCGRQEDPRWGGYCDGCAP